MSDRVESSAEAPPPVWRDYLALAKPGILRMCVITTAGGLWLAPGTAISEADGGGAVTLTLVLLTLLGSGLTVASANAFNMVLEREEDKLMRRTRDRPVAAGRMSVPSALVFASLTGMVGLLILALGTNLLTAGLAAFAIASYVLVYTPAKYRTPAALVIGAIPGAIPPLLGWTAVTGRLDLPGLVLFGILMIWQIPHFIAIALYRKQDYVQAGIKVLPAVRGDMVAKLQAAAWAVALIPVSMSLTPLAVTGTGYFVAAFVLGLAYFVYSLTGLRPGAGEDWARRYFFASLIYLPALTLALVADVLL